MSSNPSSKRRRFQAPITTFFPPSSPTHSHTTLSTTDGASDPRAPALPESIQCSLLTVGMRIRKSVPEGYKTHSTIPRGGFVVEEGMEEYHKVTNTRSRAIVVSHPKTEPYSQGGGAGFAASELLPFCGLHKVGGMAVQSMPEYHRQNHARTYAWERNAAEVEEPEPWSLPSSQDSVESQASRTTPQTRSKLKRGLETHDKEDTEGSDFLLPQDHDIWLDFSSPSTIAAFPNQTRTPNNLNLPLSPTQSTTHRAFAMPKSRLTLPDRRRSQSQSQSHSILEGKENPGFTMGLGMMGIGHKHGDGEDGFGHASFLQPKEDVDVDMSEY